MLFIASSHTGFYHSFQAGLKITDDKGHLCAHLLQGAREEMLILARPGENSLGIPLGLPCQG